MGDGVYLALGQPWPENQFDIPHDGLSFGWHSGNFLVIGDPFAEVDLGKYVNASIKVGFAEHGPLAVVIIDAPGLPAALDSARPYLSGDEAPEIVIEPADHIVWQLVLVQAGIITNLRAFTTSPDVTVFLRRVMAGQRAAGPLSYAEADVWIQDWFATAPSEADVWAACAVVCRSGD